MLLESSDEGAHLAVASESAKTPSPLRAPQFRPFVRSIERFAFASGQTAEERPTSDFACPSPRHRRLGAGRDRLPLRATIDLSLPARE